MGLISNGSTVFDAGSMAAGFGGSMVFIKKLTADGSTSTLSFVDGSSGVVLDSTYKEYVFIFKDIHHSEADRNLSFNLSIDSGSNYNVAKTTTHFRTYHGEDAGGGTLDYRTGTDLAQGTGIQMIGSSVGSDNDQSTSGYLKLFNPSSTTFVKHYMAEFNTTVFIDYCTTSFTAGYFNTTAAITAIQFSMNSGNIDAGDICLYGIA
jgi:hypothetical protein